MFKLKTKTNAAVALLASLFAVPASAALPTEVGTMLTALTADFTALQALLWPVLAVVLGGWILFKWAKKGVSKAT